MGLQAIIYFTIALGSLVLGASLLVARYVRREQRAVQSGGAFAAFAAFMILFAIGAAAAGVVAMQAGR